MTLKISTYFSLEELIFSDTAIRCGIDNTPTQEQIVKLTWLAGQLDYLRAVLGPLHVNSGYRCLELNRLIKSKDTSQHVLCEAADLVSLNGKTPLQMCKIVEASDIKFDQLIFEFRRWMHVSFAFNREPRGSVLTIDEHGTRLGLIDGE